MPEKRRRLSDHSFGRDADNEETMLLAAINPDSEPEPERPQWSDFFRPGPGQIAVAIALCVFAMVVVMQIRVSSSGNDYSGLRRAELLQVLDGLTQENRRLERDLADLDLAKERLESGADSQRVVRQQAQQRLSNLKVLAGEVPTEGPGIELVIRDPEGKLTPELIVNAIQEMRDAGAEAIEFNGNIRVTGSSWVGRDNGRVTVDGKVLEQPITMRVIGEAHALEEGARFRGGIVSEITGPRVNGQVTITQSEKLTILSIREPRTYRHARPVE